MRLVKILVRLRKRAIGAHVKRYVFSRYDPFVLETSTTYMYILAMLLWPRGYNFFFMLSSAEHGISPVNKSQITNNCKFFLAKHS